MTIYTIVATSTAVGAQEAEIDTHIDDFVSDDEVIGYARRMAEEMFGLAEQLDMDLDYSHVGIFEGDHGEVDVDTSHPSFIGLWFFSEDGAGYVTAEALRADEAAEVEAEKAAAEGPAH
jgi:hypothetical protein